MTFGTQPVGAHTHTHTHFWVGRAYNRTEKEGGGWEVKKGGVEGRTESQQVREDKEEYFSLGYS